MSKMICIPECLFSEDKLAYQDKAVGCWLYWIAATSHTNEPDGSVAVTLDVLSIYVGSHVSYGSIFRLHKHGFLDYYTTPQDSPISKDSVWHITMRSPGTHSLEEVTDGNE